MENYTWPVLYPHVKSLHELATAGEVHSTGMEILSWAQELQANIDIYGFCRSFCQWSFYYFFLNFIFLWHEFSIESDENRFTDISIHSNNR